MKVHYDKEADAAYIQLSGKQPIGGIEVKEGLIIHVTEKDELVGIEILDAHKRFPIKNLYTLEVAA